MIPQIALILTLIAQQHVAGVSEALVGKPAPPVSLELVDGKHFDLAQQRGKVVFLAFWATWCEPCRREIPRLIAAEGNHKDLVVVGVSSESRAEVLQFLKQERFDYFASGIDTDGKVSKAYGVYVVQRLFVIDQRGIVVKMIRGVPGEGTIQRVLAGLLP